MPILNDGSTCEVPESTCVTISDVLNYPSCCDVVGNICCSNEAIQKQLTLAIEQIRVVTGTYWCPIQECRLFNGSGENKLFFTPKSNDPLQSMTSVTIKGCDCPDEIITPTNFDNWLEFGCDDSCSGGIFPCGTANIEVCGSWGHIMPAAIEKAVIYLTLEWSQPGILGLSTTNGLADTVTWDDFSIKYNTGDSAGFNEFSTGYPEIDQLITPYIPTQSQIGFSLIGDNDCEPKCCGKLCKGKCTC